MQLGLLSDRRHCGDPVAGAELGCRLRHDDVVFPRDGHHDRWLRERESLKFDRGEAQGNVEFTERQVSSPDDGDPMDWCAPPSGASVTPDGVPTIMKRASW